MDINIIRAKNLANLPDFKSDQAVGLGSLPLDPDSRVRDMLSLGRVRRALSSGLPDRHDLLGNVEGVYNQGQEMSCVAYSIAGMMSVIEDKKDKQWITFNAEELYVADGGFGSNGVSAPGALEWEERVGLADVKSGNRYKIAGYGYTNPMTLRGIEAIKASVASGCPAVIAVLLPDDFGQQWNGKNGDCNSNIVTNGFHQVCVVGYDKDRFTLLNSWGDAWGRKGVGSIPWSFVQKPEQTGWAYAYTVTDVAEPGAVPLFLSDIDSAAAGGQAPNLGPINPRRS